MTALEQIQKENEYLESDLAHQQKLVRVLADKLHEWDETPNKNEIPFDFIAWAEARVKEQEANKDLIYQQKLVRVLAEGVVSTAQYNWQWTTAKNVLAWAEAKVKEQEANNER